METRANHVWVGAVTLALLVALAIFIVWLARLGGAEQQEYDIFFKQSVSGLAKGSSVSFSGVPSGQVVEIALWKKDPEFVRVRIQVNEETPILQGTTATIQGVGFTGVSEIQLDGAIKGAPEITEKGPAGKPVIPTKPGALGELLNNAPLLLERLATLTDRLTLVLSDQNQDSIAGILANTERLTGELAKNGPEFRATMVELQNTLSKAGVALDQFSAVAGSTDRLLNEDGKPLIQDLRKTLAAAQQSAEELRLTMAEVRPGVQQVRTTTLPEVEALIRDLRQMSRALREVTEKVDQNGAGSILGAPPLPEYKP